MNLITTLLASIAILVTIYASDSLREKAELTKSSLLKTFYRYFDDLLLTPYPVSCTKRTSNEHFLCDEANPAYKGLNFESPVEISNAKVLYIDLDGINNTQYVKKLLGLTLIMLCIVLVLSLFILVKLALNFQSGNYQIGIIQVITLCLLLYLIIRSINKIVEKIDPILKLTRSSLFMIILTNKYILVDYGNPSKLYLLEVVNNFIGVTNEVENSLSILTTKGAVLLIKFPLHYEEVVRYQVNFETIASSLNSALKQLKA